MQSPTDNSAVTMASLFTGVGGLDLGFHHARGRRFRPVLFCENWSAARKVLRHRFSEVPVHPDITDLEALPPVDVLTAGFPCTDLSQAGRTDGIRGRESGLVQKVLDLIDTCPPRWVLLENVRNMLTLHRGQAMQVITARLEASGYSWAYRVVDSRCTGVPQRRERVLLLASRDDDPAAVLHGEDAGARTSRSWRRDAWGFHWTEGNRGLGWVQDAVPTLKAGSGLGLASPPAVWLPDNEPGMRIVRPSIGDAERLQGFPRGWTSSAPTRERWKLLGNAVTVGLSRWIAQRIVASPGPTDGLAQEPLPADARWPLAAHGHDGKRWKVDVSTWPVKRPYTHLAELLDYQDLLPLSYRATKGFRDRLAASSLRHAPDFKAALDEHVRLMADE